ncbi:MAG: BsaWI family type II restriction enzyme [Defluviitaleaceae bacterium]|nr:BsaWI family type II restriction enzyme [Defluviitaleaceae bacterium]MCL2264053.1 BsaWI family type II restriction enzyme [Defluviitaleaceae bacterium]
MLNCDEMKAISEIEGKYYMPPLISRLNNLIKNHGYKESFRYLHPTIVGAKDEVLAIIEERKNQGIIKDVKQASKTVVGAVFSNCIEYLFLKAKEAGAVRRDIFVTSKVKKFGEMVSIIVDGESQKPDMDLVFYTLNKNEHPENMMIVSLKTSLREQAGQTYKWKLLLEIATTENPIRDKYNITYPLGKTPLVCFATVNFYDEINNPQHRGMFKFFDKSFIGKPIDADFIDNLSTLIDYANEKL